MSNLLTSLISSAQALSVYERALVVSQNNVTNASTRGYAAQRLPLEAGAFNLDRGLIGGVWGGDVASARNQYAEQAVRRQTTALGYYDQTTQSLSAIEAAFDIRGSTGISGALAGLYDSFSAWSLDPNGANARQSVLDSAGKVAEAFRTTFTRLQQVRTDTASQLVDTVDRINALAEKIAAFNGQIRKGAANDAGLDANIQNALEDLSQLVDVTALRQSDGTVTVLAGGQAPLVVGANAYRLRVDYNLPASAAATYAGEAGPARIIADDGADVAGLFSGGQLAGLVEVYNETLPSLIGDACRLGDLNRLAVSFAGRVNELLTGGLVTEGPPPVAGTALFSFGSASQASAARTIMVNPDVTADQLAAISTGTATIANGTALALSALSNSTASADRIDGFTCVEFYGKIAGRVGQLLSDAKENQTLKSEAATQARTLRSELSGVSLDEEAIRIIELQRAYQANAKMVTVLSELTEIAIGLIG